jgi:exopolysaccharide biosynthesis polyprenyl glycosylphosphotransferase
LDRFSEKTFNFKIGWMMLVTIIKRFSQFVQKIFDRMKQSCAHNHGYDCIKRMTDILISIIGLLLAIPVLVFTAIAIRLESAGPAIYRQTRTGKNGKLFTIYKLRSMRSDSQNGTKWTEVNDPRITKVGRFIRKTRIDEIPQLYNILKGDMSLVGPRPERPFYVEQFSREIPGYLERLQVKPGLTGWAQINGGYEISTPEKLAKDLEYIQNRSITFDLIILFKTIYVMITGRGAR